VLESQEFPTTPVKVVGFIVGPLAKANIWQQSQLVVVLFSPIIFVVSKSTPTAVMNTIYTFRASDGVEYEATQEQLRAWVSSGRIRLDDTVIDFLNGQPYLVRDILAIGAGPTATYAQPGPYAAYPRDTVVGLPPEMSGTFNWGAFLLTWIWGLNHRKPILLLVFVPCVGLFIPFWAGFMGNRWAWESGRFQTGADCKRCQEIWTYWGLGFVAFYFAIYLLRAFLLVSTGHPG
jgi:hypothetical protein